MVGNDVVDLADVETRELPRHARFDARVFARVERRALAASAAPKRLRWMLWAAKEAAYKLAVKRSPGLGFSPRRFVVTFSSGLRGGVEHPRGRVAVRLTVDADCVHAVASEPGAETIVSGVSNAVEADVSLAVRRLALRAIAAHLGVAEDALLIGRRGRVPTLGLRGADTTLDLSLSHHGRFLAFACETGALA